MEECDIQALAFTQPGLHTQLRVCASRRLQLQVGSAAIARVSDLCERRRLEAATDVGIDIEVWPQVAREADHRVGGAEAHPTTVVRIARAHKEIPDPEIHPVGTQSCHGAPGLVDEPVALHIDAGAVDTVVLIPLEFAPLAQVVDEAATALAHALQIQPCGQAHFPFSGRDAARPPQSGAAVTAVQLHDAAGRRGRELRDQRNREPVVKVPLAHVHPR